MSEFEAAIRTIMEYYDKYANEKGIKKGNFQKMIPAHLNHMLTNTETKKKVEEMFRNLDQNQDKVIDFDEYWDLIGNIVGPYVRNKQ